MNVRELNNLSAVIMGNLSCEILLSRYVDSYAGTLFSFLIEGE